MKLPTDHELKHMVFSMWHSHLNLEANSIALCMASKQNVDATPEYKKAIHEQLKRLVREKEIARQRFLKGKPYYWPG